MHDHGCRKLTGGVDAADITGRRMTVKDSLCIALDGSDRRWILATAGSLADHVGWLKVGLEAFVAHGPRLVAEVAEVGPRVFLDLKLHDIPATVERAAANCAACGAAMLTVHAAGGRRMLEAAVDGAGSVAEPPRIVAVTLLTSLDGPALTELGIARSPEALVLAWADLARDAGASGVVASAREASALRASCGDGFLIVTPGIRPGDAAADDQRRVVTPSAALAAGADLLVVGRPVTRAPDPVAAVKGILAEMSAGLHAAG
jgi:orotidine-5'-phosphate decarboxylase